MNTYLNVFFYDVDQTKKSKQNVNQKIKQDLNFRDTIIQGSILNENSNKFNSNLFEIKLLLLLIEIHISLNNLLINIVNNDILIEKDVDNFQDKLNLYLDILKYQSFGFMILNSEIQNNNDDETQFSNALLNKDPIATFVQENKERKNYNDIFFESRKEKIFNTENTLFVGSNYLDINFYPQDTSLSTIDTPYNSIIIKGSLLDNLSSDDETNQEKIKILRNILSEYMNENNLWIVYFQYKVFKTKENINEKFLSSLNNLKKIFI